MKIVFFGTPSYVVPILETLFSTFDVVGIVTAPDHWVIRKKTHVPSAVKKSYQELTEKSLTKNTHPLQIFTPQKIDDETVQGLKQLQPDLFVIAAYGKILPKKALEIPPLGTICVHPSVLPKYRGPSPVTQTLLDGENVTGTSLLLIDEQVDHGPVLRIDPFEIHETDTFDSLMSHLFKLGADMLPEVITDWAAGKITPVPQDDSKATFTHLVSKQDGFIDFANKPDKEIVNRKIRAYFPWPTAWTIMKIKHKETRIKILPGNKLQLEGKNVVNAKEILASYPEIKKELGYLFED